MARTTAEVDQQISSMDAEQLPAGEHELHGPGHFAGLYAAENVAGTEFVFGATFVILGASIWDAVLGLFIGNLLAVLSFRFLTAPIATRTRLSLYTYLAKIAGQPMSRLYNAANALIFATISAAMITVSATAVRRIFDIPPQAEAYPTSFWFIVIAVIFASVAVLVAAYGFNALAEFATICGPWLMVMFVTGGVVLLPAIAESVTGATTLGSWRELMQIGGDTVFTGKTPSGGEGISLLGIIGYSWAANAFAHFGLIDMALFRYAKKSWYGYMSSTGMLLGHYVAWISAGFMGAATAAATSTSITVLAPGDVAWHALAYAGYITVIIGGWTTANANLYRAGLAGQGVFPTFSRARVTLIMGLIVILASVFPFVYRNYLNLVAYAGAMLVPVGGIVFAEHYLLPRLGLTRFWSYYKGCQNTPALWAWGASLLFLVVMTIALDIIPVYVAFLPAWAIAALVYVLLARRAGARQGYPQAEADDQFFQERVQAYHARQAESALASVDTRDRRPLSWALRIIWIMDLAVISVHAGVVLFLSPDMETYLAQREQFYIVALIGTLIYFAVAYAELRRNKAFAERARSAGSSAQAPLAESSSA